MPYWVFEIFCNTEFWGESLTFSPYFFLHNSTISFLNCISIKENVLTNSLDVDSFSTTKAEQVVKLMDSIEEVESVETILR